MNVELMDKDPLATVVLQDTVAANRPHQELAAPALTALLLSACGGGGGGGVAPIAQAAMPTEVEASRFLAQASMGADRTQIASVQSNGYAAWLEAQFSVPQSLSRCDWLVSKGYDAPGVNNSYKNGVAGFDACAWRKLLSSPDTLRQRVTLALSEILVVSVLGLKGGWRAFSAANYLDILENNAFGNYRTLLQQVSTSPAMGEYLTFRNNVKYNPVTDALPDENYAREIMQLFTIGLHQLNRDGTPVLSGGQPQDTYAQSDVTGLARVFTGWVWDTSGTGTTTPDFQRRPMVQNAAKHETGASTFLGSTVPAGLSGEDCLTVALDILFAHPNVSPFVSKQLIQRLVTSNPSPAYVQRVVNVFENDGTGVKGNLQAVVRAILLDDEARNPANLTSTTFGKLREPMLRFTAWARAYAATSPSDAWTIGDTSNPATRLGQSPLRSPTVFNFFRPGYVPPNSALAGLSLVAPELQLCNESSVVGYVNYMQGVISGFGVGDFRADYTALLALADDAQALLNEINTVVAAGQIGGGTVAAFKAALDSMPSGTNPIRLNRVYAALVLMMAAPEFQVLK